MKNLGVCLLLVMGLVLGGCKTKGEAFVEDLMKYYESEGINTDEVTVTPVKEGSLRGENWFVFKVARDSGVEYAAIDLSNYEKGMSIDDLMAAGVTEVSVSRYEDDHGNSYGSIYVDSDGRLYEQTGVPAKDLEKVGAFMEQYDNMRKMDALVDNFGLSESRALEMAKLMSGLEEVRSQRGLTSADADAFMGEVLGTDFESARRAVENYNEGQSQDFERLVETAARQNGVSPEHMKSLLEELL